MNTFKPDYHNIEDAAKNIETKRLPLYEHIISDEIMERVLNKKFRKLLYGTDSDIEEYFHNYCGFFLRMGYDTVSFECCIGPAMPGSGSLGGHIKGVINTMEDYEKYPWDEVPDRYFNMYGKYFDALRRTMPEGMKAIGGVGNGIFEAVQDVVGYMDLCYISVDDPELYCKLFKTVGRISFQIWDRFLRKYGDMFCVCRFGDDLGFKNTTLISAKDIRTHIIPEYKKIINLVHKYNKPFLLHSCGCIFDVMDDLIEAGIDAKHSNEDQIALFPVWVEKYGDRIGNFGGIDTDAVCRLSKPEMKKYIYDVIEKCKGHGGFAFASGNSIPNYVPVENYLNMVEIVREYRGDFK
ncbi:MAG: uroporphyrinogen decarboxylase family protein [Clostridiales bacterium]|nr:uroporphyrinogen decarboxylase family protein [Clostridiales bacterium]